MGSQAWITYPHMLQDAITKARSAQQHNQLAIFDRNTRYVLSLSWLLSSLTHAMIRPEIPPIQPVYIENLEYSMKKKSLPYKVVEGPPASGGESTF
jgi:hypothetical protein